MSFNLFISCSAKDKERINQFLSLLQSLPGLEYFFFEEKNELTQHTRDNILARLKLADAVLLFNSVNGLKSNYVQNEIGVAVGLDKLVIIGKLDKTNPDGMLKGVNYLDFYDQEKFAVEINRLTEWIRKKIAERQAPQEVVQPEAIDWPQLLLVVVILAGSFYFLSKLQSAK